MGDWTHSKLQQDLLISRRENGEIAVRELSLASWGSSGWADVVAVKPSWTNFTATCYEVKATRSDFMNDARNGKYRRYLPFFHKFYFATPAGMMKRDEVPEGAGLIVRGEKGWSGVCAPKVMDVEDSARLQLCMAMMFRQAQAPWRVNTENPRTKIRKIERYEKHRNLRDLIGQDARDKLREARQALKRLERARKRIARVLGEEPGDRSLHDLTEALVAREATDDEVVRRIQDLLGDFGPVTRLRNSLTRGLERVEDMETKLVEVTDR